MPINSNNFKDYIYTRLSLLSSNLEEVNKLAEDEKLIDASINNSGIKIASPINSVPNEAYSFNQKVYSLLPKINHFHLSDESD